MIRLLDKDPSTGMDALIDQYAGLVYAVVRGKLADYHYVSTDIEDCVADVFSKFYVELSGYDPAMSSIKSYLCVIARNLAINVAKRRALTESLSLDGDDAVLQIADDEFSSEKLDEEELRREVIRAVEALGEPDSSILFRKYYYGESSKEIAKAVGMTVSNVDTRAHRALQKLRKMFGGRKE